MEYIELSSVDFWAEVNDSLKYTINKYIDSELEKLANKLSLIIIHETFDNLSMYVKRLCRVYLKLLILIVQARPETKLDINHFNLVKNLYIIWKKNSIEFAHVKINHEFIEKTIQMCTLARDIFKKDIVIHPLSHACIILQSLMDNNEAKTNLFRDLLNIGAMHVYPDRTNSFIMVGVKNTRQEFLDALNTLTIDSEIKKIIKVESEFIRPLTVTF